MPARLHASLNRINRFDPWIPARPAVHACLAMALLLGCSASVQAVTITEFPVTTAAAAPSGVTTGPDGNLWFGEATQFGTMTTAGAITEYASAGISRLGEVVTGPDGNLWSAEKLGNAIASCTPLGVITRYTAGMTAGAQPRGMAVGPDGNLWFCESAVAKIGMITTAGTITEFPLTAGSLPDSIVAAPDGALWFTESGRDHIGRITTAGVVTEIATNGGSQPFKITVGPDGALWFTELNLGRIARMTTAGAYTEYTIPTGGSQPAGIVSGPAGSAALWFTEFASNQIGVITTAGAITEYAIPTAASGPLDICVGPDGNVWFSEQNGNALARLDVSTAGTGSIAQTVGYPVPSGSSKKCGLSSGSTGLVLAALGFAWARFSRRRDRAC